MMRILLRCCWRRPQERAVAAEGSNRPLLAATNRASCSSSSTSLPHAVAAVAAAGLAAAEVAPAAAAVKASRVGQSCMCRDDWEQTQQLSEARTVVSAQIMRPPTPSL